MKNKKILVSLPLSFINEIDRQAKREQYYSRSEYLRDLIRAAFEEKKKNKDALAELQKLARKNLKQYGIKV